MDGSATKFDPKSRWGEKLIDSGFCIIPEMVIKKWSLTGLDATDLAIITNLAAYWWTSDKLPHPSTTTLARNLSVSKRTIERRIRKMVKLGLLSRGAEIQEGGENGPVVKEFNLSGLIKRFEAV